MSEVIVKIIKASSPNVSYKLVFPSSKEMKGEVYWCRHYESRSGLHWESCIPRITGPIRLIKELISYCPAEMVDSGKEGKNIVGVDFMKNVAPKIIDELTFHVEDKIILYDHDCVKAYRFKPYDRLLIIPDNVMFSQSNLVFYKFIDPPRWLYDDLDLIGKDTFAISGHALHFNKTVFVARTLRHFRHMDIEAAILIVNTDTRIAVHHFEHGIDETVLEPGFYYIEHISTSLFDED